MWLSLKTKNLIFSSWPMAAILDLMIAELLPRLWTSTSLIFHVWGPVDQVQVRNSPNTCLRTGLQANDRIKYPPPYLPLFEYLPQYSTNIHPGTNETMGFKANGQGHNETNT